MNNILILLIYVILTSINLIGQKLILEQDQRLKGDNFYYEHTDLSYFAKSYKNVTGFAGYRFIVEDKGDWKRHSRFHLGANVKFDSKLGKLVFRNRYEFTPGHELGNLDTDNGNRFRERIKYYLPFEWTKYKIQPNFSDEFFFNINNKFSYSRNRVAIGIAATVGKFKPELYYFKEFKKNEGWRGRSVFGFLVKYEF